MWKIALWEAKHPKTVLLAALLLLIPAALGFLLTRVNYDILSYLPDDLPSAEGEHVLDETFHTAGISVVILEDGAPRDASDLKQRVAAVLFFLNSSETSPLYYMITFSCRRGPSFSSPQAADSEDRRCSLPALPPHRG